MDIRQAMQALERAGTAQNRKVYARHGVSGEAFGVSFAALGTLRTSIGTDHELARALWASGNHDARVLATMVADPEPLDVRTLDAWMADVSNSVLADALSALAARSPAGSARMRDWMASPREWTSTVGFNILARRAAEDGTLADAELLADVAAIEARLHGSPNRTRYAMNMALIGIGTRNAALKRAAQEAARRLGTVHVDHGETGCKTPSAYEYIEKAYAHAHRAKKATKAAAKKATKAAAKKTGAGKDSTLSRRSSRTRARVTKTAPRTRRRTR